MAGHEGMYRKIVEDVERVYAALKNAERVEMSAPEMAGQLTEIRKGLLEALDHLQGARQVFTKMRGSVSTLARAVDERERRFTADLPQLESTLGAAIRGVEEAVSWLREPGRRQ